MNKEELLHYNIVCGTELLVNCYYDEVLTDPKPLQEWIDYVYNEIVNNYHTQHYIEMGNKIIRTYGEKKIKEEIIKYLNETETIQKYILR